MQDEGYQHRFHAGNVGDVWKHNALAVVIDALRRSPAPLVVFETHAGAGAYQLGPTGEWTEGIGRLWAGPVPARPELAHWLRSLPAPAGVRPTAAHYPGSPLQILTALGPQDRAVFFEIEAQAAERLRAAVAGDARAAVYVGDGLRGVAELVGGAGPRLVVIDPPFTEKTEWQAIPSWMATQAARHPGLCLFLWYPIKSYTRPNALLAHLREAGLAMTALELVTTPLELQRNRLNGSGVVLVNPPSGVVATIAACAPEIGARCATHHGHWTTRILSWHCLPA